MCGITGIFGPSIIKNDLNVFHQLMFLNQLRGMHSTGVLRVFREHSKKAPDIRKDVVTAQEFLSRQENQDIFEDTWPVAIMGHCRHATVGNADNILGAHPFENEKYIGFHNGTLKEDKYTKGEFFTDSENLYNDMAKDTPEAILANLEEDSAFALAYYNKEDHTVNFIKNKHRPLAFAVHRTRNVVYYSSEIEMLEFVLERFNIPYDSYTIRDWKLLTSNLARVNFNDDEVKKNPKIARTNLWKITHVTPTSPVKPVVHQPNDDNRKGWYSKLWGEDNVVSSKSVGPNTPQCSNCREPLVFNSGTGVAVKESNPKEIEDFGIVCPDCFNAFMNNNQITKTGQIVCS